MTWPGLPGTATPQSKLVREIDRSDRPPLTKLITSLTAVGLDELRVRLIMRQKPVGIGGKAEEPAFLHGPFHRRALGGELCAPLSLCQFLLVVKSLVAARIPPRSAERRVGKECVSTCRSRCSP